MIKIEKIQNGYTLQIEHDVLHEKGMKEQMDETMKLVGKMMPDLMGSITSMIEKDPLLHKLQNQNENQDNVLPAKQNKYKYFFADFKNLLGFMDLITQDINSNQITLPVIEKLKSRKKQPKK